MMNIDGCKNRCCWALLKLEGVEGNVLEEEDYRITFNLTCDREVFTAGRSSQPPVGLLSLCRSQCIVRCC